jgi:hypothetical protein
LREIESGILCQADPATLDDLDWIFQFEIETYSAIHAVARLTLENWYISNPDGFSILTMNGRKIGHLTIVPLHPRILESFRRGTVLEQDIQADSLYTPGEKQLIKNLYVESIIIDSHKGPSVLPIKALTRLAHDFVPLMRRVCDPTNLENIYALAASSRGERFMKRLGFEPVKSVQERADNRTLYVAKFSKLKTNIAELYNRRLRKNERSLELR